MTKLDEAADRPESWRVLTSWARASAQPISEALAPVTPVRSSASLAIRGLVIGDALTATTPMFRGR